jgi:predicted Zn finger-like uncharacterized protein
MPRLTCPECDADFKPKIPPKPGKKVRCPECEHAFLPETDEEADGDGPKPQKEKRGEDDKPAGKSAKKRKKKSSPKMLALILGGGAVILLVGLVCAGGTIWLIFGRGGAAPAVGGPDGGGKSPNVSKAAYDKLEIGMTNDEIDAILAAPGSKVTRQDAIRVLEQFGKPDGKDPLFFDPGARYILYKSGGQQILVGFGPTKKYGDLCGYKGWFDAKEKKRDGVVFNGTGDGLERHREHFILKIQPN